jgi:S-formylglutathione hydrolase FrmB
MPSGERGFYTDNPSRPNAAYETYITKDIIGFTDRTFHTIPEAKGRVSAGLSMGGYGGVKFALKFPDLFSGGASLSGALAVGHLDRGRGDVFEDEFMPVFGPTPSGGENDLFALAAKLPLVKRPPLFVSCGTEDFLIEQNRSFHAHLTEIGYAHTYEEHPGAHTWSYWNRHILKVLAFFAPQIGLGDVDFEARL